LINSASITEDVKFHASSILKETQYPVLPARVLSPTSFNFPPNSLESKKALLISMTPMLTEGENQRKFETKECEEFTRCRVEKSKLRASSYEYIDLDTNSRISGDDYTQRFVFSISSNSSLTSR
jgi:hypothetical protein